MTTAMLFYLSSKQKIKSLLIGIFLLIPFCLQVIELLPLIQHTKKYPAILISTIPNHSFSALTETLSYSGTLIALAILITLAILKIDN
jgi:hypothetical protein